MKRPSKKVMRGLDVLIPVISIIIETPNDSELQEVSEEDVDAAAVALQWIVDLVNSEEAKKDNATR